VGTASLYGRFVNGTLAGNFSPYVNGDGGTLQKAIWALEDEISLEDAGGMDNPYLADVKTMFGSITLAKMDYVGNGVRVLNIYDGQIPRQDMLYFTANVPEVSSGLIVAMCLGGMVLLRRK